MDAQRRERSEHMPSAAMALSEANYAGPGAEHPGSKGEALAGVCWCGR